MTLNLTLVLPEDYRFKEFTLTVIEKSDAAEIRQQTARLDAAGKILHSATLSATPPEQETKTE